jgi:hypothetical protein
MRKTMSENPPTAVHVSSCVRCWLLAAVAFALLFAAAASVPVAQYLVQLRYSLSVARWEVVGTSVLEIALFAGGLEYFGSDGVSAVVDIFNGIAKT